MGYILFTLFRSFWTSSMTSTASTSNPPLFLVPFGLPRAFPPLQSPIHHFPSHLLDFLRVSLRFKVQSTAFSRSFWTSSCLLSASKSNPPLFLVPFGLSRAFSPLQSPIRHIFLLPFYIYIRTYPQKSLTSHNLQNNF